MVAEILIKKSMCAVRIGEILSEEDISLRGYRLHSWLINEDGMLYEGKYQDILVRFENFDKGLLRVIGLKNGEALR